ncbi:DedA family protein [Sandaracinus amylolyticus]|uniref:DedA protein n=1 Tax=Sandaracinus amylolyticus TaxID=927083 RepID=A0A0F6YJB5_9BACT|nr:VTT domain-containing protein [Sandaracinus amylolyticus]AKF07616.1 DedA protein [Sandaracinus amylolyticus]
MDALIGLFHSLIEIIRNPGHLIEWGGYPGMALIVFLETGALVFFLPGDSLLVMAGLYAAQGSLDLGLLNLILIPCAIIGDATSYWMGAKTGPRIFSRPKSFFFDPKHALAARDFYEKHGGKAIIISRFMPLVRTFVPVIAGVAQMPYRRFAMYNVIGAVSWVASMTIIGYALGQVPGVIQHIEKIIILVVLISVAPGVVQWLRTRMAAKRAATESTPS